MNRPSPCRTTRYNAAVTTSDPRKPLLPHPQEPGASPQPVHGDDVTWWIPSWQDRARLVGWRWILALPAVAVLAVLVAGTFRARWFTLLWMLGPKPLILAVAIPIVLLGAMVRKAAHLRKEPFCIHCGYALLGLPDHYRCPECGRPYTFALIDEYRRDPHWFIERYKARGRLPDADQPFAAGAVPSRIRFSIEIRWPPKYGGWPLAWESAS